MTTPSTQSLSVSVVIPLYNKESTIAAALECIFAQTFPVREIIIINDGSTDNSVRVLEQFEDPRIKLHQQPNRGVGAARNTGWQMSSSNWIAFLDADDLWKPQFLEQAMKMAHELIHHDIVAVGVTRLDDYGIPWIRANCPTGLIENFFEASRTCGRSLLHASAIVIKKEALEQVNGFPENIQFGEDNDTWCRLAWTGPIGFVEEPLVIRYELIEGNTSRLPYPVGKTYPAPFRSFRRWKKEGRIPLNLYKSSRHFVASNTIYYLRQIKQRNNSKVTFLRLLIRFTPICIFAPNQFINLIRQCLPQFNNKI